jgi:hypothetical protein
MVSRNHATPVVDDEEGWEEKGHDHGDIVVWKPGEQHEGIYEGRVTIMLPVSEQNPDVGDGTGGPADILVFSKPEYGTKWSTWVTYQLREAFEDIAEGMECRIKCTGERKAKVGNVKVFSVKVRAPRTFQAALSDF